MTLETIQAILETLEHDFFSQNFKQVLIQGEALLQDPQWISQNATLGLANENHLFLDAFLRAVTTTPADVIWRQFPEVQVRLWCAQSAYALQDFERAHTHLNTLMGSYPHAALAYLRGCWYSEQGLTLDALEAFAEALKKDPLYIEAYEAMVTLANMAQLPELAFALIQQASQIQMTPRLLEELLLASGQEAFVSMRSLFLELCVHYISPSNQELLGLLLTQLYQQEDYYHCTYLGFHLLSYGYWAQEVRHIYVLAALHEKQMAQVLQLLLRWPSSAQDALYYFHGGQAFLHWNMPHFALDMFNQGLTLAPEDTALNQAKIQAKAQTTEASKINADLEGELLKAFLKRMAIDPGFKQDFIAQPRALLLHYHLAWSQPWERLWKMLQNTVI